MTAAFESAATPEPGGPEAVGGRTHPRRGQRQVRTVDFSRPSKFTKDQLRTLQMLHEGFCRGASTYLSATVRSLADVTVTGAEQILYGEYVATLPVPSFSTVLELSPLGTAAMASIEMPLLFAMLDRMLGGPGPGSQRVRELTAIEQQLASSLTSRLLQELSVAWAELVPVEFKLRSVEMNAQFAQIAAVSEPSVLVTFNLSIGSASGDMQVCIPYRSIEQVVGNLTPHRYFASDEDAARVSRAEIMTELRSVTLPVRAVVGAQRLPISAVQSLKAGDVVPLGRRVSDGVSVMVGSTHAYRAAPGRDGRNIAVRVVERLESLTGALGAGGGLGNAGGPGAVHAGPGITPGMSSGGHGPFPGGQVAA